MFPVSRQFEDIHRVAITNSRIISTDNGKVTFRYKDSGGAQIKTMTVSAEELIRRFLQHVLPAGVHKVRYYGLWSSSIGYEAWLICDKEDASTKFVAIENLVFGFELFIGG